MAELKKRERMLIGLAGSFLLSFVFNQFVCTGDEGSNLQGSNPAAAAPGGLHAETPIAPSVGELNPNTKKRRVLNRKRYSSWGKDPFYLASRLAELDSTQQDSGQFVLRGIIWKGDDAHALIGDAILRAGESTSQFKVLRIEKDRVVCKRGSRIVTLMLREDHE